MTTITDHPLADAIAAADADGPRWLLRPGGPDMVGCVALERTFLLLPQFFPITADGRTFRDAFSVYGPLKYDHLYGPEMARIVATRQPALLAAADAPARFVLGNSTNHFHWLADFLPRLAVLESRPALADGGVLVNADFDERQQAGLDLVAAALGLAPIHPRPLPGGIVGIRRAAMPTSVTRRGAVDFWRRVAPPAERPAARLFVRRGAVPRRQLVDEAELAAMLAGHGFTAIDPGALPLAEQVRLFADAAVIVGVHGAALANILLAPASARVIELRAPANTSDFRDLANAAGQGYAAVPVKPIPGSHAETLHWNLRLGTVGLERLRRFIGSFG